MNNVINKEARALDKTGAETGARIAARRKQLGLTQGTTSEAANISLQFFACVERGIRSMRARNVIKVASALSVSTDYILFGTANGMDDSKLSEMLKPLSQGEWYHPEEIIRHYVQACGYHV